jgi:hypothetical protein
MADTAAWLVDDVIPDVPVRQWVLSVPFKVRFALARDAKLLTKALGIFLREVSADLRRRTGGEPGDVGAVTGIQRFGGSLNLNVHFHAVVLDGVYREGKFRPAPRPKQADLDAMVVRVRRKIESLLRREGVSSRDEEEAALEPLELFQAASIRRRVATSADARAVAVVGGEPGGPARTRKRALEAGEQGYSIHGAVRMKAADRKGREILLRYVLRPSFAEERMTRLPDGRIAYGFRRAWDDGSSHVILTPMEMMAKLAALVPPPRYHLVRYHGVLAPNSKRRRVIVKAPPSPDAISRMTPTAVPPLPVAQAGPCVPESPLTDSLMPPAIPAEIVSRDSLRTTTSAAASPMSGVEGVPPEPIPPLVPDVIVAPSEVPVRGGRSTGPANTLAGGPAPTPGSPSAPARESRASAFAAPILPQRPPSPSDAVSHPEHRVARPAHARRSWAALMLRTLMLDVLKCPNCTGRMKVIACIDQPEVIEKFLRSAGLWTEPDTGGLGTRTPAVPFPDDSPWAVGPDFPDDPPPDPALD